MVSVPMSGVTGDTHIIAGGVPAQADLILTYIAGTEATGYSRGGYIAAYGRIVRVGRLVEAVIRITTRAITGTWSGTVVRSEERRVGKEGRCRWEMEDEERKEE